MIDCRTTSGKAVTYLVDSTNDQEMCGESRAPRLNKRWKRAVRCLLCTKPRKRYNSICCSCDKRSRAILHIRPAERWNRKSKRPQAGLESA
jgi:hypothetical protein